MQIQQKLTTDTSVEFIEDPEAIIAKLRKIKLALSDSAKKHRPVMAYDVLLKAFINNLALNQSRMFYFPIPWEVDVDLPSHPSLIADARHYCQSNNLSDTTGVVVDSFAEWRLFKQQNIFCCCGKNSTISRERTIPIGIMLHHSLGIDHKSHTLEIKQLIGIRSTDRNHIENHYNLHRNSRVNDDISIIGTYSTVVDLGSFELMACKEEYAKQFDTDLFVKMFADLCRGIPPPA